MRVEACVGMRVVSVFTCACCGVDELIRIDIDTLSSLLNANLFERRSSVASQTNHKHLAPTECVLNRSNHPKSTIHHPNCVLLPSTSPSRCLHFLPTPMHTTHPTRRISLPPTFPLLPPIHLHPRHPPHPRPHNLHHNLDLPLRPRRIHQHKLFGHKPPTPPPSRQRMSLPPPPLQHHPRIRRVQHKVQTPVHRMRVAYFAPASRPQYRRRREYPTRMRFKARGSFRQCAPGGTHHGTELRQ